ncbi:MAG TPA: hypothetical protein DCP10_08910, partial [Bacteroidales bacterium]|nr:hypothetical protein [Bacteroidales bacterium]
MKKFDCKILSGLLELRKAELWKVIRITLIFITMGITQSFALGSYTLNNSDAIFNFNQVNQQHNVSGKVKDSGGQPLPGVTVVVKGTTQGTVTNADGEYSLSNIPEDATLVFSFVGMRTQEVVVGSQTSIDVRMEEETIGLEEVVAIGYGTQKKETLTGSVASVKGEELAKTTIANVSNTLAGQLPGLIALQSNGMPGRDAATLSIRGFGNALFIVDGIEADINTLDPNSIESISILKDGAASIYGARAGNGVILVTTKRGN